VLARKLVVVAITVAVLAVLGGGTARAQPAPAPAPRSPAPGPDEATIPDDPRFPAVIEPPPGFDLDPAWTEYDSAFRDAAVGDIHIAKARLIELEARWPRHPAQARAAALMRRLEARRADPDAAASSISKVARSELVFWSTLGGASLALNLCAAIDCTTHREYAGVYTLTMGSALAASLFATRHGVRQGEAQLYNSAQTWGAWNALLINDGFAETEQEAGISIAMQLGGLAAGIGLWQLWRPTQGDVALTNTFLLWGSVLTVWGHLAANKEPSLRAVIIAGDVSILLGALISRRAKVSRGRTLLIDVGGVLGSMTGGLAALASDDESGAGVALLIGTSLGLGLGILGTRTWDKPAAVKLTPAVIEGPSRSRGYGFSAGLAF
jgi:hypothetical protein